MRNAIRENTSECSGYVVSGSYQILPNELLEIRRLLLSTGKAKDLQLYCIMIISIKLFLRHDEFHSIQLFDVQDGMSDVDEHGQLNQMVIRIKGKTDKVTRHLVLWADNVEPRFCPIRHLLLYVYYCEIKNGYLFPNLNKRDVPGDYDVLLKTMKYRFKDILVRKAAVTTHSFRKTGYLFAIWGGAPVLEVMKSARHKTEKIAANYACDAKTLKQMAETSQPDLLRMIGPFKMSIIENTVSAGMLQVDRSFQCLYKVAQGFMSLCGIRDRSDTIPHLMRKVIQYQYADGSVDQLNTLLGGLSIEKINQVKAYLNRSINSQEARMQASYEERIMILTNQLVSLGAEPNPNSSQPPALFNSSEDLRPAPKKRKYGDNDLDGRKSISKIREPIMKLHSILDMYQHVQTIGVGELT